MHFETELISFKKMYFDQNLRKSRFSSSLVRQDYKED